MFLVIPYKTEIDPDGYDQDILDPECGKVFQSFPTLEELLTIVTETYSSTGIELYELIADGSLKLVKEYELKNIKYLLKQKNSQEKVLK